MSEKSRIFYKRQTETTHEVDLTRRAVIIGGASLLATAFFGCRAATNQKGANSRNIGADGRDYTIQPPTGAAKEIFLEAREAKIEIAPGKIVKAWTYDGKLPGTEIRVKEGERVRIALKNNLPQETTIHWHGQTQRGTNNMDGVPDVTQAAIQPGASFVYDFRAEPAGSFIYHPHVGLQIERGLVGAFIVEPTREVISYDREYTIMIDDWLEGSPDDAFEKLKRGEMQSETMSGMESGEMEESGAKPEGASGGGKYGANSEAMEMEEGADVAYQTFLINGKPPENPAEFTVKSGERVRFRVVNPSGSTVYRFAVGGHKLTVTHADGIAVQPVEADALEIAPGERYDVLIEARNAGAWTIAAMSTDEPQRGARGVLRYTDAGASANPSIKDLPKELNGRLLNYNQLVALDAANVPNAPERLMEITLGGQMSPYVWTINGKTHPAEPFEIRAGERVRLLMKNTSLMRHPMHLHGHSFRVLNGSVAPPLKDTAIVEPNRNLEIDFFADNPGDWAFHCHHAYHLDAGMMRVFKYV